MDTSNGGIDGLEVGDSVVFERTFTPRDFEAFRALSGDSNPLHHDAAYAASTPFQEPIVPLHMTLAPLSMIAGMVFPGEPALYLSHEVRAARPVRYGEILRYSARIAAINLSHRVLTLRVLGLHASDVVLDAVMRIQCRKTPRSTPPLLPVRKGTAPAVALVTGSSGEIGTAISVALAKRNWRLLLQDRGDGERRCLLRDALARIGAQADFLAADLTLPGDRAALADSVSQRDDLGLIVHAASPAITAPVDALVSVNFSALKEIADAALPALLARQNAAIVLIGSNAIECAPSGWEGYAGAKGMAATFINGIEQAYAEYGVRGFHLLVGMVATEFSAAFRGSAPALLPGEVADALLQLIDDRNRPGNTLRLDLGEISRGRFGFHTGPEVDAIRLEPATSEPPMVSSPSNNDGSPAAAVVRKLLRLPPDADLVDAGLGVTPGWDSLRHIELLVAIESSLGIRFGSGEMEGAQRFSELDALCRKKIAARRGK